MRRQFPAGETAWRAGRTRLARGREGRASGCIVNGKKKVDGKMIGALVHIVVFVCTFLHEMICGPRTGLAKGESTSESDQGY